MSLIPKFAGIHHEDYDHDEINGMRCGVSFVFCHDKEQILFHHRQPNKPMNWVSRFFNKQEFINFMTGNKDIEIAFGQTQYNTKIDDNVVKIHGDPTINHHDWVVVKHGEQQVLCHILCFVEVTGINCANVAFPVGNVSGPGLHAICNFVNQDVFSNVKPQDSMYGNGDFESYRVDENCSLVRGWAKYTNEITSNNIPRQKPKPVIAMFSVDCIVSTCSGIEDLLNPIPHSYIFLPPKNNWPTFFQDHMMELMEIEGDNEYEFDEDENDESDDDGEDEDDEEEEEDD